MILGKITALNTTALNETGTVVPITINAGLTRDALNTAAVNGFTIEYDILPIATGRSRVYNTFDCAGVGVHDCVISHFKFDTSGFYQHRANFDWTNVGHFSLGLLTYRGYGYGSCMLRNDLEAIGTGRSHMRNTYVSSGLGWVNVIEAFEPLGSGVAKYGLAHQLTTPGWHQVLNPTFIRVYRQGFRIANDSLERWELYVGQDQEPDFSSPTATGTSLPVQWAVPTPDPGETIVLHVVARKRNKYGLLSLNRFSTLIEIDENTVEDYGQLTTPELTRVLDGQAQGELVVFARYPRNVDRYEADAWELYVVSSTDPDPVPGTDTPVATAMFGEGGAQHAWRYSHTGLTPGDTYKVLVAVRRDEDKRRESSAITEFTLAEAFDLDTDDAGVFAGQEVLIGDET